MPPTLEVACENAECELDMFELHYSYEMSYGNVGLGDFNCPFCGESKSLRELTYTYRDSR